MTADDQGAPEAPREPETREPGDHVPRGAPTGKSRRPRLQVALALVAGALLVAVNVVLIQTARSRPEGTAASAGATQPAPPLAQSHVALAPGVDTGVASEGTNEPAVPPPAASDDPSPDDGPPSREAPPRKAKGRTVQWAAERACSTAHVDGLSRQIIEEARCLDATAFARVPARRNLASAGHVFLYLDAPARDHLLRALDAHPDRVMKVHSALRTVAQQYLLSRWADGKRCGIQLATRPGESNHETGLALDVAAHGAWRSALESEGFRWLGSIDRVHFDFVGAGAAHHDGLDVRAFQRLWNRNHADDVLAETGRYDAATEQRLKRSPAGGFPSGAHCGGARDHRLASGGPARGRGR